MSWLAILCIYTIFIFLLSYLIYSKNQVYYRSLEYNNPETLEKINVHKLYPEFAVLDKNSFLSAIIFMLFLNLLSIYISQLWK